VSGERIGVMMMKRLWVGTVEIPMVVWAESKEKAIELMKENAGEELRNGCVVDNAFEVESLDDISYGWDEGSIPWGNKDEISIRKCFKQMCENKPSKEKGA